jgi:hypothetical protein
MGNPEIYPLSPMLEIMDEVRVRGITSRGFIDPEEIMTLVFLGYTVEEVCNYYGEVSHYRVFPGETMVEEEEKCSTSLDSGFLRLWHSCSRLIGLKTTAEKKG